MPHLCWDDHSAHVMSLVSKLYKNLELTDCTLDTSGGLVCGHKALLGACSPYLKKLIVDHQGMEIIRLKEVKFNDMKLILDFVYFGELDVSVSDWSSLIKTARLLQIPSLSELSLTFSEKLCSNRLCDGSTHDSGVKCTVNGTKCDNGDLSFEVTDIICNQDNENEYGLSANTEHLLDANTHSVNVLKDLSQPQNHIILKNNVPNSIVSKQCMTNVGTENFQDDLTPFSFVAVSPCSVKIEHNDDDLNDACGSLSEVDDPLEGKPVIADIVREIKREREVQLRSEFKKENEVVVNVNESNDVFKAMGINCVSHGRDNNVLQDSENICGVKSTQNVRVLETVGCNSGEGSFAAGMGDLQIEFEAVSDIPKHELSEVKLFETGSDNEAMDDNDDTLTSYEVHEPLNCEAPSSPLINIDDDVNQATEVLNTKRMRKKELLVVLERIDMGSKMKVDTKNAASEQSCNLPRTLSVPIKKKNRVQKRDAQDLDCSQCVSASSQMDHRDSQTLNLNYSLDFTAEKPYQCDICGSTFSQNNYLKVHARIHSGDKPYTCDICGKTFSQSGTLKVHRRIHTGEKPYKCDICGISFTQKIGLEVHTRIHTGEKPYKCDICGTSFTQKIVLEVHTRIHTGEKPYKCDICGISFSHSKTLKDHTRIHSRDKPYKCDICGSSFSQRSSLKRHFQAHVPSM